METPPSIHLQIDRVILDGLPFTTRDAAPIRAALETELSRLLGEHFTTAPPDSLTVDALPASLAAFNPKPAAFGREIAATFNATFTEAFPTRPFLP